MITPSITDDDEATGFFEPRSRATYSGRNAPSAHGQSPLSVPARSSKRVIKKPVQEDDDGDGMTMLRPAPSSAGVAPRSSARLGADAPSSMIRQHLDAARAAVQTGGYAAIPSQPPPPVVDDKPSERTIALPPSMSPAAGVPAVAAVYNQVQQSPMHQPPMQQHGFAPVPQAPNTLSGVAYAQSPFSRPGLQQGPVSGMVSSHGMQSNHGGVTNPGVPSAPAHFMAHRPPQADPPAAVLTAGSSGKARGSWFGAVAAACVAVAAVAAAVAGGRADGLADSTGSLVDPSRGAPRAAARGVEAPATPPGTPPATPTAVAAPIAANPQAPTVSVPVVNMGQSVEPAPGAALDPRFGGAPGQPVSAGQPVAAVTQPAAQQPAAQQPAAPQPATQQPVAVAQPQAQLVVPAPRTAPVAVAQPRPAARPPATPSRPAAPTTRPAAGKGDMDDAAKLLEKAQLEASQSF